MDGITNSNRIDNTTERKLHGKVVDNILEGPTYFSRLMGKGQPFMGDQGPFEGKTADFTLDIQNSTQFEWFTGIEDLNSAAEDTTITLSYAHTAGTQPKVSIMLESFANAGSQGTIPLDAFKYQKAAQEALRNVATAAYATGSSDRPNGLQAIVDNGTNAGTIGGKSRTTYTALNGTYTTSNGVLSLSKLGTLDDAVSISGDMLGSPNINVTTFTAWSLFEQLLDPSVIANYNASGFPTMPVRGDGAVAQGKLGANGGFTYLSHRGRATIKDKFATTGVWYKNNEETFGWMGRTIVPDEYKGMLSKVDLGSMDAYESIAGEEAPSSFNGWFYQKPQMMPNSAGTIARFYVIGQMYGKNFRMNGQLHSITGV